MINLFDTSWRSLWGDDIPKDGIGAIYTKEEVVHFILDLAGYSSNRGNLCKYSVLEPSCGSGAFALPIVERMINSCVDSDESVEWGNSELDTALCAVDINPVAVEEVRSKVEDLLLHRGCPVHRAHELVEKWVFQTDFLLHDWAEKHFDFVLGNPPYVRIEHLPKAVMQEYRRRSDTATERADLYVSFIEHGLRLLSPTGKLGFICANRFAKNRYGEKLRALISREFHVGWYLNLEHTQPFQQEVSAYPAILIVDSNQSAPTYSGEIQDISPAGLQSLLEEGPDSSEISRFGTWYRNGSPWISTTLDDISMFSELEEKYPLLEDSADGTKVGIGVATGADDVYILPERVDTIEEECQLPLLLSRHIGVRGLTWTGEHVINPFESEGKGTLVNLNEHPGLAQYLSSHESRIRNRYVARQRPERWYRTIDRIHSHLVGKEKLVIPDIQPGGVIGYDSGEYYPHHNVYFILSNGWDLRALQALLRSSFVRRQMKAHSVQMRGGSLRYQAGTLRKLRVPHVDMISKDVASELAEHACDATIEKIDRIIDSLTSNTR